MVRRLLFILMPVLLVCPAKGGDADADDFQLFRQKASRTPLLATKFTFVRVEYDSVGGYSEAYYNYAYRRRRSGCRGRRRPA